MVGRSKISLHNTSTSIKFSLKYYIYRSSFILGHAKIREALEPHGIKVATGEACQNRVIFKQLMQAKSIDFCQIDTCRVGGVTENLSIILMAAKFGSEYKDVSRFTQFLSSHLQRSIIPENPPPEYIIVRCVHRERIYNE